MKKKNKGKNQAPILIADQTLMNSFDWKPEGLINNFYVLQPGFKKDSFFDLQFSLYDDTLMNQN